MTVNQTDTSSLLTQNHKTRFVVTKDKRQDLIGRLQPKTLTKAPRTFMFSPIQNLCHIKINCLQ